METSPNEMVNEAIERAAIVSPLKISYLRRLLRAKGSKHTPLCLGALQRPFEALLALEHVRPTVAGARQPLGYVRKAEVERMRVRQLLPSQWHGYRGARRPSRRVSHIQRLSPHIHVVVHEDLAGALRHAPFQRDVLRVQAHEMPADALRHLPRRLEVDGAADRQEDVQPGLAGSLDDRLELHAVQQLAQAERHLLALLERHRVELWLVAGLFLARVDVRIDVEHDVVRIVEHRALQRVERRGVVRALASAIRREPGSRMPDVELERPGLREP